MQFDRPLRGTQLMGNLLVQLAANQHREDFVLARRQARQAQPQGGDPAFLLAHLLIADQRTGDRRQQPLLLDRLGQEILRTGLDRLHGRRNIPVAADEDDGQPASQRGEAILQLRSAQARHLHVQQDAGGFVRERRLQQLRCGFAGHHAETARRQQIAHRGAKRRVVIDDIDLRRRAHHAETPLDKGRVKRNAAPPAGRFSAHILPP